MLRHERFGVTEFRTVENKLAETFFRQVHPIVGPPR
jgi:hypothetical protein